MDLRKLDPGPYADADEALAMLRLGIISPALADDPHHLRVRGEVVIDLALNHCGVDDLTSFETTRMGQIAQSLSEPTDAAVIAGWIRRAYLAGHLASLTRSGPVHLEGK